jgi:hypothetical protein
MTLPSLPAVTNVLETSARAIRGNLRKIRLKSHSKNLREDVLVTVELTLLGTHIWNIAGTRGANPCYRLACQRNLTMDSLPTGSTQSWLIVAAVAFSPVIVLFLADAIGWLIRQPGGRGSNAAGRDASGIAH